MCLNKRWITNKYDGRRYFVSCGHCPACLQEKAVQRTNRIRYNFPKDGHTIALFCTLTYRNSCAPYMRLSDLSIAERKINHNFPELPKKCDFYREVPIYRDSSVRWNRVNNTYNFKRVTKYVTHQLTTYKLPFYENFSNLKPLRGQKDDKISVAYYPDLQNFIKRLRQNLLRKYNYENNISFFSCSEYGPKTCRAHFHLLIFCPSEKYKIVSDAIASSWSYDDYNLTRANISIAKDCASYVSSYVNSANYLPSILSSSHQISPSHSYSHGFGSALDVFSLPKIFEAYRRGDLSVTVQRMRKGTLVSDTILLPKYLIHRACPKFKGYNRLASHEINLLVQGCYPTSALNRIARICEWDDLYKKQLLITLANKRALAKSYGISVHDYADMYSRIYSVYSSNLLKQSAARIVKPIQNFYAYDNIISYYLGDVSSPSLDSCISVLPDQKAIFDPNQFPYNVQKHLNLSDAFHSYSKDRKIRNFVYEKYNM